jgi:hypothetical protein
MCEHSLHVAHRSAKEQEQLKVQMLPGVPHMRGLYPRDGDRSKLVCIRKGTQAVIHEVKFERITLTTRQQVLVADRWEGKKNVKVTIFRSGYTDTIDFENGDRCYIQNLKVGVAFDIGMPVITGKDGMKVVEAALSEQDKTTPTPEGIVKRTVKRVRKAVKAE